MGRFNELRDFDRRFHLMTVKELTQWKCYWIANAASLAPDLRRHAMNRVHRIEEALQRKTQAEVPREDETECDEISVSIRKSPAAETDRFCFLVRKSSGNGPLVWRTTLGRAILAFKTEELAYYLASRCRSAAFRHAKVIHRDLALQFPLFRSFEWLLVLDSFEAIDRLMLGSPGLEHQVYLVESPWWNVASWSKPLL
jgi:hypothetical protein